MPNDEVELVEFYRKARLPDEQTNAILAAGQMAAEARRWQRIAVTTSVGLMLVGCLAAWLYWRGEHFRDMVAEEQTPAEVGPPQQEEQPPSQAFPQNEPSPTAEPPRYQFVAFRSHDDNCPHCRATGQLFAELKSQMNDASIDFEAFELQKASQREQTMQRIEEKNLTSLVAGRNETAFALLLSPTGNPLKRFVPADGAARVRAEVAAIIDQ